jgi:hypothetical protein
MLQLVQTFSPDGAFLAKAKNFTAAALEVKKWTGLFHNLPQCRQGGLSYGEEKSFVRQDNESRRLPDVIPLLPLIHHKSG